MIDYKDYFNSIKREVLEKGGALLSTAENLKKTTSKLEVKCKVLEHPSWKAEARALQKGQWCKKCHDESNRLSIEEVNALAEVRGGKFISTNYTRTDIKYEWECAYKHRFQATTNVVKFRGSWCPACSKQGLYEGICKSVLEQIFKKEFKKCRPDWLKYPETGNNLELDGYSEELKIAFEFQGFHHYQEVEDFRLSLEQIQSRDRYKLGKCQELGIKLIAIPGKPRLSIAKLKDFIFNYCDKNQIPIPDKQIELNFFEIYKPQTEKELDVLRRLAESKDGKLISTTYLGCFEKLTWFCNKHQVEFHASPNVVKSGKSWCKKCGKETKSAKLRKHDLNWLHQLAVKPPHLDGKCLSTEYPKTKQTAIWKCGNPEHPPWKARPDCIAAGAWCLPCSRERWKKEVRPNISLKKKKPAD